MTTISSTLVMAVTGSFAAIAIACIGYAWLTGVARNPEAAKSMFTPGIIALAMAEFVALLAFVITLFK